MLLVCIFVPLLSAETPKPFNVVKVPSSRDADDLLDRKATQVIEMWQKIAE